MSANATRPIDPCPFIDDGHPRCDWRFTLSHLSEAFGVCVGGYRSCPTYWRLVREQPQRLIMLTAHGRPLQPTGT